MSRPLIKPKDLFTKKNEIESLSKKVDEIKDAIWDISVPKHKIGKKEWLKSLSMISSYPLSLNKIKLIIILILPQNILKFLSIGTLKSTLIPTFRIFSKFKFLRDFIFIHIF